MMAAIGTTVRSILRWPIDVFIVFGIKLRARLWTFLWPKPLYRPLGPNDLRLLIVHRPLTSRRDELVRCTLFHESLEHTPEFKAWDAEADPELRLQKKTKAWYAHCQKQKDAGHPFQRRFPWGDYIALSYCWGNGLRSHRIIVNGQLVDVTETLESALRSVRGDWGLIRLWADALCINQDDIAERGREVRRMRGIYGDAGGVFVHLGPEADNSTMAMQMIERMAQQMRDGADLARYVLQVATAIGEGRPAPDREGLIAVFKLLCRPYWSRMWIIQELAMGESQVTIGCGEQGVDLSEMRQILKFTVLNSESLKGILPREVSAELAEAYQSTIQLLWSSSRVRDLALLPAEREFTYSELCHPILRLAQYASATDARDKVYGAMSLFPASLASRVDRQEDNYKYTAAEVFMNFTRAIIDLTNDLDVIYTSSLKQKELSKLDLPSWSPDYTLRPGRAGGTGSSKEWFFGEDERYAQFDKSYSLPTAWTHDPARSDAGRHPQISFSEDGKLLFCQGFHIATLSGMCSEIEALLQLLPDDPAIPIIQPEAVNSPYGSEEETIQALLRTILLEASGGSYENSVLFKIPWFGKDSDPFSEYGAETTELFDEMLNQGWDLRLFGGALSTFDTFRHHISQFTIGNRRFQDYFPTDVVPCPPDASQLEFSIAISNLVGRRLVTTATGHIGLAPATAIPGDKIYVLIGCSMPVILRPDASGKHYEIVGECSVDGFMKGEAMTAFDAGEHQLREIILC